MPRVADRTLLAPAVSAGLVLAVLLTVAEVDPNQPGHYPACPFLTLTGWYCPGCGTLRALHALTQGDVGTALARNPLTTLSVSLLLAAWTIWSARRLTGRGARRAGAAGLPARLPGWAVWGAAGTVVAFWVLRNQPGLAWLAP